MRRTLFFCEQTGIPNLAFLPTKFQLGPSNFGPIHFGPIHFWPMCVSGVLCVVLCLGWCCFFLCVCVCVCFCVVCCVLCVVCCVPQNSKFVGCKNIFSDENAQQPPQFHVKPRKLEKVKTKVWLGEEKKREILAPTRTALHPDHNPSGWTLSFPVFFFFKKKRHKFWRN